MQTALVSAAVAAIVTLLVEFVAKPGLELRKDRLLTEGRARRELLLTLGACMDAATDIDMVFRAWPYGKERLEELKRGHATIAAQYPLFRERLARRQRRIADELMESMDLCIKLIMVRIELEARKPGCTQQGRSLRAQVDARSFIKSAQLARSVISLSPHRFLSYRTQLHVAEACMRFDEYDDEEELEMLYMRPDSELPKTYMIQGLYDRKTP